MSAPDLDEDALRAGVDMIGRTGARSLEFGYLHEGVPVEQAGWWATALYRGTKLSSEGHRSAEEAVNGLAQRLLTGAKCTHCGGLISLFTEGGIAHAGPDGEITLLDGSKWNLSEITRFCRYRRIGPRWVRGCERPGARGRKSKRKRKRP